MGKLTRQGVGGMFKNATRIPARNHRGVERQLHKSARPVAEARRQIPIGEAVFIVRARRRQLPDTASYTYR